MKKTGRENAKWDIEEEIKRKDSWTNMIDWGVVTPSINFSTEYPKGTPTTNRSLTYAQSINIIAEQLHLSDKNRFKTTSEILRLSLHIGISVLYSIFLKNKNTRQAATASFFFKSLESMDQIMTIGQIVSLLEDKEREFKSLVKKGSITKEMADAAWSDLYMNVPDQYKVYVKDALMGDEFRESRLSKEECSKLLSGIPSGGD